MRGPFQRHVFHGYPSQKFEANISANFPDQNLVTVTLETLDGISPGDTIIETHFEYVGGQLLKTAERPVIHQ